MLALNIKKYAVDDVSEKVSMARLKNAIIKKSRLVKPSKIKNFFAKEKEIKKIYENFITTSGGKLDYKYALAEKIKDVVIDLLVLLKKKEIRSKVLKILFIKARLILELVLRIAKINPQYILIDGGVNHQIVVITCFTSGTVGFVCSWFSVAAMILTPSTIFSVFVLRNLALQILHNNQYKKLNNSIRSFLENRAKEARNRKEIQEQIEEMWKESMDKTTQDMIKRRNENIIK